MHIAACKMRAGEGQEGAGEVDYQELLKQYPNIHGIKLSYIDSLLFVKAYQKALEWLGIFDLSLDQ